MLYFFIIALPSFFYFTLKVLHFYSDFAGYFYVNFCNDFSKNPKVFEKFSDNRNIKDRVKDMAESFNLNNFLQTYKTQTYDPTKLHAAAEESMETRRQEQAEAAVRESGLLTLTLSEKLAEFGIGERVLQQFADTATNFLLGAIVPIGDYLEKYENIFDQSAYNSEIQTYAKQMFFASQAMQQDAAQNQNGQNFVYDM